MKSVSFYLRYILNGNKFIDEDKRRLTKAWNEYLGVKKVFHDTFSNGRAFNYDSYKADVIVDMVNNSRTWTLVDYIINKHYSGSATLVDKQNYLLKQRINSHKLSEDLFIDYNMLSKRADAYFIENNGLRVFRCTNDNLISANKISGINFIYLSRDCLANYELIAIARAQQSFSKLLNLIKPLYEVSLLNYLFLSYQIFFLFSFPSFLINIDQKEEEDSKERRS